jgi:leader peptidase (prepilin peptidase)/N-methyltransferase
VTWFLDAALVAGAVGLVAGALVPEVVARLPEPAEDPEPEVDALAPAESEEEFSRPIDEPKELYADLARVRGLRLGCSLASGLAAATIGARVGWSPALLFLVYLVPVGVALAVVDWRTRYLPTRLIAPSYVVVGVLVCVASALERDRGALVLAVVGWLATFTLFFLSWFVSPRMMSYGDVRLAGLLGLALGWLGAPQLVIGIYTGFLLGAVGATLLSALKVFHHKHYPFGPFMVAGAWVGVVLWVQVGAGYAAVVDGIGGLLGG